MPLRLAPISGTPYVGGTQPGFLYVTGGLQTLTTSLTASAVNISTAVADTWTNPQQLVLSWSGDAANYRTAIQAYQSGTAANHGCRIQLTTGGVTTTAITFTADGYATFGYTPIFAANVGIKTIVGQTPHGVLELADSGVSSVVHVSMSYSSDRRYRNDLVNSFDGTTTANNMLVVAVVENTGTNRSDVIRFRGNQVAEVVKNLSVKGGSAVGTNGDGVIIVGTGTAPASSPADAWQLYSTDAAAGNACPTIRTENGDVVKLYKTGTYTATNVVTDRAYDANATTVDELADVLGTLIADLRLLGVIG